MPAVESSMIEIGSKMPDFNLLSCNLTEQYNNEKVMGQKGLLVMFVSKHCPYVKHLHSGLQALWNDYKDSKIGFVAISSNDAVNYPDDSPKNMIELWQSLELDFPVLYDESQDVAKSFDAQCTPDFFIYNSDKELVYRGRFDESTPGNGKEVTGSDIRMALDNLLNNENATENQLPSIGCSIKWK